MTSFVFTVHCHSKHCGIPCIITGLGCSPCDAVSKDHVLQTILWPEATSARSWQSNRKFRFTEQSVFLLSDLQNLLSNLYNRVVSQVHVQWRGLLGCLDVAHSL
ncbi:hypothetical protein GDO81_000622 [Engystomops pustulosus]|uniref:Uncharacterized protein n=1 Tax=Engystomops pustulosus TaxID=76066 RepID=A0AAV7D9Q8_ENGPU|nr:hypothetical protein GDO81_000622 [Engystomops pustulosus]